MGRRMTCNPSEIEELRAWYLETIGYDPFEDGATVQEVREIRAEYEAAQSR